MRNDCSGRWQRILQDQRARIADDQLLLPAGLLVDETHGDIYNSDSAATIAAKHAALLLANPLINGLNALATVAVRLGQSAAHIAHGRFWPGLVCLRQAACAPVVLGILQGCCLMGLVDPYLGRAWFARAEGHLLFRLAPCFAPLAHKGQAIVVADLIQKDQDQHLLQEPLFGGRW